VLSPAMTVVVLAVLWLVVVVPMILRRNDERRRERSVDGFGRAMRALGRRAGVRALVGPEPLPRTDVFVPQAAGPRTATAARRPVPAVQEALMYPVDPAEMSEARTQMMARRRRSLFILVGGSVLFGLLGFVFGGLLWWLAAAFGLGLLGYLYFLRTQALHDRDRRAGRQERAVGRRAHGFDATSDLGRFEDVPDSVVRIDDDDLALHSMDTIDLTGLYSDEVNVPDSAAAAERRAS
jgi:membrane protein implicated in regulation of membrane protease activity